MDERPIYALADYANRGRLLERCRALLMSPESDREDDPGERNASYRCGETTETTSGYQTSASERPKQRQTRRGGQVNERLTRREDNTANSHQDQTGTNWRPSSWLHKSQQDQGTPPKGMRKWSLSWRHLIEPVNYGGGKLPAAGSEGGAQLMDWQLDGSYGERVSELSHEIGRAISNFMVDPVGQLSSHGAKHKDANQSKRSPTESLDSELLAASARGGSALLPPSEEAQTARLRRLGWRQKLAERRVAPTKLVRSETFDLNDLRGLGTQTGTGRQVTGGRKLVDHLLADVDRPSSTTCSWSGEREARGRYGESLVHVLLVNHSDECLLLLVLLLKLFPRLLLDTLKSDKFQGLNCLHLAVANKNPALLEHLLELAAEFPGDSRLVHQQVTGSLFRSPIKLSKRSSTQRARTSSTKKPFWCDQQEHWPTANGCEHLILYDRIEQMANSTEASGQEGDLPESYKRTIYFGQSPLAWAVAFDSKDMFELLVSRGRAEVELSRDHQQNNCLHLLIINSQQNWTRFLLKFSRRLGDQRNSMQLTPFLLACHLGRVELFNELLELSAVEFWTYSSVRCCAYPLASLDPIIIPAQVAGGVGADRKRAARELKSAVSVILESERSSDEQKAALLATGIIKRLLEEKWKIFARRLFYTDLSLTLLQLILTTFACFMRPSRLQWDYQQELAADLQAKPLGAAAYLNHELNRADKLDLLRNLCELLIVAISLNRVRAFSIEWFRYKNLSLQFTYNPLVANLVLANLLIIACLPLRAARLLVKFVSLADLSRERRPSSRPDLVSVAGRLHELDQLEESLLILASPLLWSSLLFFVAAFQVTGPFVAMINYMLMRDAKQFSLIYLVFLCSFAQSIFLANRPDGLQTQATPSGGPQPGAHELWLLLEWISAIVADYAQLWLELFKMTLGVYELQPFRRSLLSRGLLMLFIQLIPILFNMLIAMMNNTYSRVISQSERAWSFQWARTLFALERRLSHEQKVAYLKRYAINLSSRGRQPQSAAKVTPPGEGEVTEATEAGEDGGQPGRGQQAPPSDQQEGGDFVPGLMIIKQTGCTKAELRRRLLSLWQKSARRLVERSELDRRRAMVATRATSGRQESN